MSLFGPTKPLVIPNSTLRDAAESASLISFVSGFSVTNHIDAVLEFVEGIAMLMVRTSAASATTALAGAAGSQSGNAVFSHSSQQDNKASLLPPISKETAVVGDESSGPPQSSNAALSLPVPSSSQSLHSAVAAAPRSESALDPATMSSTPSPPAPMTTSTAANSNGGDMFLRPQWAKAFAFGSSGIEANVLSSDIDVYVG